MIKIAATGESFPMDLDRASARRDGLAKGPSLASLFHEHLDFVWRTARRLGLSGAEADDVAQRVFLVAANKLAAIRAGEEKSFLFGTTKNVAKTMLRSRNRRREDFQDDAVDATDARPNPEETLEQKRACNAAERILLAMPDELRDAFVLFELEDMTTSEIARLLNIPMGTVASRIRRAREFFRSAANAAEVR